jgi:(1->4)-alpha-D-glucan 1-alpha-D-glucosylmutase
MTRLSATARLQFHAGYTLHHARAAVPYLARLGISHLYASPLFSSVKGSTHGYDVTDSTAINPELGGREALEQLVLELRRHDMGLVLDIVPNHMASTAPANAWFTDVLRCGRTSKYAQYFDIDWDSAVPQLAGKMLLPILAEPYAQALESGNLKLHCEKQQGAFTLLYFDRELPLAPESLPMIVRQAEQQDVAHSPDLAKLSDAAISTIMRAFDTATPAGRQTMHQLLEMQHYRLAFWQNAADEINWRRFFEISDLIGVSVERPEVFEATHVLIFELYRKGLIDGVRVDHIDGLAAPEEYCQRLRQRLLQLQSQRPPELRQHACPVWLEKILAEDEKLERQWQSDGTTGYEFMNDVLRVLIDPAGETPLTQFWVTASDDETGFDSYETRAREQILGEHLAGEFGRLCDKLTELSNTRVETRDMTGVLIRRVMFALLVAFRVYRIYTRPGKRSAADQALLEAAAARAREVLRPADHPGLDVIMTWLGGEYQDEVQQHLLGTILARFEQLSAPLAAKAVEDTAFYRYGRMLALNEVGGSPARFYLTADQFHARMQARFADYPIGLSPLATHDHKRGADTRARLAVLSERAEVLATLIRDVVLRLETVSGDRLERISPVDLLMLLQSVLGSWPLQLDVDDQKGLAQYRERLAGWQQKAVRESKINSNWLLPNTEYEATARAALDSLFETAELRRPLYDAVQQIAPAGALNGLIQVLLQCTVPGTPDIYQGSEMWDFSLVDPDNRRPVDFAANAASLALNATGQELMVHWRDGRIKQWLVARLLQWRRMHTDVVVHGRYLPLVNEHHARVLAFSRDAGSDAAIVLAPLHVAPFVDGATLAVADDAFKNMKMQLPNPPTGHTDWRNFLTEETFPGGASQPLADIFKTLPFALLIPA